MKRKEKKGYLFLIVALATAVVTMGMIEKALQYGIIHQ